MQIFPGRSSCLLVLAIAIVDCIWIGMSNIAFPVRQLLEPVLTVALLLSALVLTGRLDYSSEASKRIFLRLTYLFQGLIFLQISWIALRIFNHLSMTTNFDYADSMLIGWDEIFGFNWTAYFHFVEDNQTIKRIMRYSYTSLTFVSFVGFFILALVGEARRTRFFLESFLFTAVICTAIGMFFPAKAAVAMYYGDAATLANLETLPGVYHIESLERLRSGVPFSLDLNALPGLVTFPSFHTAAGIILAISFWRTALFPLILAYSAIMIASTPVYGGHYFVDLIGGAGTAVLVACAFASRPIYNGMFARTAIPAGQPEPAHAALRETG